MTKFVAKFRKNQDYNEDYNYKPKRQRKNEHSEIKKMKNRNINELMDDFEDLSLPSKNDNY